MKKISALLLTVLLTASSATFAVVEGGDYCAPTASQAAAARDADGDTDLGEGEVVTTDATGAAREGQPKE